jgi:hypothetical protein
VRRISCFDTANLDRPSISVIGCRRPSARTAAHCALRPRVCWRLRRKAHRLDVRQGQKFKPHHHATAWHTPSGRISARAARDGRERAPACREARSIARKHPFRKVRSCKRGLSGVTSGASADDTSDLPWRGARLRRSRPAARAQRTCGALQRRRRHNLAGARAALSGVLHSLGRS